MLINLTQLVRDEGSVVVFEGLDNEGLLVTFGVDHRTAQDLVNLLEAGEDPDVEVPEWSILKTQGK